MSSEIFATLKRLSARYKAEYHTFTPVNGKRVNRFGRPVEQAYAVVSDEQARKIDVAERSRNV